MCLALALAVCAVAYFRLCWSARSPVPPPSRAIDLSQPAPTLALLGDGQDPWCSPLFDEIRPWAADQGWQLVTYDCAGSVRTQQGQLDDLLRTQTPKTAILYDLGDATWQDEAVERLEKAGVWAVTLSRWGGADVGPVSENLWTTAAEGLDGGVLLLADLPEDPALAAAREALGEKVLGSGACWATPAYAADYLDQALPLWPQSSGVLCLSREGALGAKDYAQAKGLSLRVLSLDPGTETAQDLALGRVDGVIEVSREGVLDALEKALGGKTPEPLAVTRRTSQP